MRAPSTLAFASFALTVSAATTAAADPGWIVTAEEAVELVEQEDALLLDTRGVLSWRLGHVPKAQRIHWRDFSTKAEHRAGRLDSDTAALTDRLQALGVRRDAPVLVAGAPPDNWGEAGRIVWMLRTLGHPKAALVDGGVPALFAAGASKTMRSHAVPRGNFVAAPRPQWVVEQAGVRDALSRADTIVVDTREAREFHGATPHGEQRGGHLPGAKHLHYADLMDARGFLLPERALRAKLTAAGVTPDKRIIAYCTGGVRSAWLTVLLVDLGFENVQNYSGSTWEWSAGPPDAFPLQRR